ncbi:hypothetical protein TREES_T100018724 [Tupaia chinensis]|uniref:Uncharacterized protein n=1 Tax=Tupaia chinensis TaxID=246437 RepID=L9KJ83_TUPCH|nr:hypothetical protein TREES_T100018724 [Tupaia chinensis]
MNVQATSVCPGLPSEQRSATLALGLAQRPADRGIWELGPESSGQQEQGHGFPLQLPKARGHRLHPIGLREASGTRGTGDERTALPSTERMQAQIAETAGPFGNGSGNSSEWEDPGTARQLPVGKGVEAEGQGWSLASNFPFSTG